MAWGHETSVTGESDRSSILTSAVALARMRVVLSLVGTVLAWGVGGALFSVAILRTSLLPVWVGWLGLVVAVVVWLTSLQLFSSTFERVYPLMLIVGLAWFTAMGGLLLLIDPATVSWSGFVQLGGAAELVAVGMVIVMLIVSSRLDVPVPYPDPANMDTWLSEVDATDRAFRATTWLFILNHLFEIVFMVALYHLFRDLGPGMLFALLAGALGLLLVAASGILQLGLAELAASYATAEATE